ncbi:hypothetical protein RMS29_015520 [Agrobacterium rosae]|uniref:Uncharacterized protein n=1 Tax=Agrobacterium rosae TaxID=1972867 RepID=A0ABU4W5L8_9HYPH|nr:hypothetical protein [Agrobacterium rosae]MDX8333079.1 hypothetical protein [Agrobacterium rosae]
MKFFDTVLGQTLRAIFSAIADANQFASEMLSELAVLTEAKAKIEAAIAEFYDHNTAKWFMDAHGNALLAEDAFHVREGVTYSLWAKQQNNDHVTDSTA